MDRVRFLTAACAGVVAATTRASAMPTVFALTERPRVGARLSLAEILRAYPAPASGDLLQYELGFGATYDKQIGFGHEIDGDNRLLFVESQVGNGDHACNPNTLKKAYVRAHAFGNVFTPYPALSYVTRSGNMLTRWGDGVGPKADPVLLLDAKALYDPRRATIVSVTRETVTVDRKPIATTRIAAHYAPGSGEQLRSVILWLSPAVPLGVVKMTATAPDVDAFNLSVYTFSRHFRTEFAMSLQTVRGLTPTGYTPIL